MMYVCGTTNRLLAGAWALVGVFSTKQRAVDACATLNDFIAPVELDAVAPTEHVPFPSVEFPIAEGSQAKDGSFCPDA